MDFIIRMPDIVVDANSINILNNRCAGDSLDFDFSATNCFHSDNIFYLIISDTLGSFDNVVDTIGMLAAGGGQLTMAVQIPHWITYSNQYKIKIVTTSPVVEYVLSKSGLEFSFSLGGAYIFTHNLVGLTICKEISTTIELITNDCFEDDNYFQFYIRTLTN